MIKLTKANIDVTQRLVAPGSAIYINRAMILWMSTVSIPKEGAEPMAWTDVNIGHTTFSVMETPEEIAHANEI